MSGFDPREELLQLGAQVLDAAYAEYVAGKEAADLVDRVSDLLDAHERGGPRPEVSDGVRVLELAAEAHKATERRTILLERYVTLRRTIEAFENKPTTTTIQDLEEILRRPNEEKS
jgi:hypothetical protein